MSVTLADIARKAKVSPMTASRALRGIGRVNAQTREHVLHVAKELGYYRTQGTVLVPRIRKGTSDHSLKVLLPVFVDESKQHRFDKATSCTFGSIKDYLAHANGKWHVECFHDIEQLEERWDKIRSHGIVVRQPLPREWVARLTKLAPVVYMTPQDIYDDVDAVVSHEARTTTQILNYLNDHGHQNIAWIGIKDTNRQDINYSRFMENESLFIQRSATTHASTLAAWWMLMGLDELACPENLIILQRDWNKATLEQIAEQAVKRVLAMTPRPTAIVPASDGLGYAMIQAAKKYGIEVPRDMSMMSYGSKPVEDLTDDPMTCVALRKQDTGSAIVELIERRMANPDAIALSMKFQGTIVEGQTVKRITS
ncbi:MAG: LacI family DNA-binding transcriptional regulator [Phycisphaeraceae bacterium JB051]